MAYKIKAKISDNWLIVKLKVPFRTAVADNEIALFSNKFIEGFLSLKRTRRRVIEYSGPIAVTLNERLKKPLTERDYLLILEQIIAVTLKLRERSLPWNKVNWDVNAVFVNENTKLLKVMYIPFANIGDNETVVGLIHRINDSVYIQTDKLENCVIKMKRFLSAIGEFDPYAIQEFIAHEDPAVFKILNIPLPKSVTPPPPPPPPTGGNNPNNPGGIYNPPLDGVKGTSVLGEETSLLTAFNNEDEYFATGLLGDLPQKATVHRYPALKRISTGELVDVNKPVFRIGKERSYVDYFVTNNNNVSRGHADVITKPNGYFVVDRNSKNKTYINDKEIPPEVEVELRDGDLLTLGNEYFVFIAE